jgi:sugar phosphate isomerase/epimerase
MADSRLGVHTFIFQQYGFDHTKQTERIAETVAKAGFGAIEFHQPVLLCGLSCSGKQLAQRSDSENDHAIEVWTELGEIFRSHDIGLAYHNHGEPEEDIQFVLENTDPDFVSYCADVDWLRVGGVEPCDHILANSERITHLHLRDYHAGGERTVALGEGDFPFSALASTLDAFDQPPDLIVELALPSGTPPDRPLTDILSTSLDALRQHLSI